MAKDKHKRKMEHIHIGLTVPINQLVDDCNAFCVFIWPCIHPLYTH